MLPNRTIIREFFTINQPVLFFVCGLIFFILGLAITLRSRRYSRLILGRSLHWLALFGFLLGLSEWGDVFIPIQAIYLPPHLINLFRGVQLGLLALSFTCLFQYGIDLLRPMPQAWTWLRWLPVTLLVLWLLTAMIWLIVTPITLVEWLKLAEIWTRYLFGLPGAMLVAYSLRRRTFRLIAPLGETQTLRTLRLVGLALIGFALMGGLVVPPAPFPPATWLNTALLEAWLGIPVQVFRSLLGLIMAVALNRALGIFELELDSRLSALEEAQILVTERERIGRELHDHTFQMAYAAGLMVDAARHALHRLDDEVADNSLSQAEQILGQAVTDIRRYITNLQTQPTGLSLAKELTQLIRESTLTAITEVKINLPEDRPLSPRQMSHLLAIAREALINVAHHARAECVKLAVQIRADNLCLSVTDDGNGFPPDYVVGYGLRNMQERARLLGGELVIKSRPGQGARLELVIPCDLEEALQFVTKVPNVTTGSC
ncbi:MAG: sensor histidine kinase [Chloroflexi bacterium]|nr:sensor histidine kinase [Chloroflexota bacterium]